jgi:Flp pilus assembly protein, protease CpaA
MIALIIAAFFDIKYKKIPNQLTFPLILWGILSSTLQDGLKGFQFSIMGILFGIAIFILPFAVYMIGGGDVKLMGAVGAFMGWKFTLTAVLYSSIVGGVIAIILLLCDKNILRNIARFFIYLKNKVQQSLYSKTGKDIFLKNYDSSALDRKERKKRYIPYGVAITIGTLLVLSKVVPNLIM